VIDRHSSGATDRNMGNAAQGGATAASGNSGEGEDRVSGADGNDTLRVGAGTARLLVGAVFDTLDGVANGPDSFHQASRSEIFSC
jgi:Ca2+-binding RTX toxin-like protein